MTETAHLETMVEGELLHVTLTGEIDVSNALLLEGRIEAAAVDLSGLVVDLTGLTFLDSSGVRLLDHLVAGRGPDPAVRVVTAASGPVPFTLRLCGFRPDLLAPDVPSAVAALTAG